MSGAAGRARNPGRPGRPGPARRMGRLAAVTAAATAAAMVPAAALTGGGRAAPAGHPPAAVTAAGVISTLAGGVGGPGAAMQVALVPCGMALAGGNLYVATEGSVRKVSSTGFLTTPAGTEALGRLGDGGPAARASLGTCGIAVDHAGNLVIADLNNHRIRVVAATTGTFYGQAMTAGGIYTVAGNGTPGFSGDGGPATAAELQFPWDVRVDSAGNLVIADQLNRRIRVVAATSGTFYGRAMAARHIYTVAGGGTASPGDGGPATSASLASPAGMALDAAGNLVVADSGSARIRVVAASTGTFYGQAMTARDIYTVAGNGRTGLSGEGGLATSARLNAPSDPALDHAGNLVIADTKNNRVRVVAATTGTFYGRAMTARHIYTVAGNHKGFSGDGGPAAAALLNQPGAVKVDGAGNLLIADTNNFRVRVVAATSGTFYGQVMTAGNIDTVAGNGNARYSGDHGPAIRAQIANPRSAAVDGAGNVVIADELNGRVRVVAATAGTFYGQAMTAGNIYTVAGTGGPGFSGDGGPATQATLLRPASVTVDDGGNLVIADTRHSRVRVVAATAGTFYGRAMTAGNIYTVAGNGLFGFSADGVPATGAALGFPEGAGADQAGNLLIADTGNSRIRVVAASTGTFYGRAMTAGDIYTVAGGGRALGDGGPARQAALELQSAVTVDHGGNLVIADTWHNRVRVVAVTTGTFYGQAMTAGDIYTVAGTGSGRFSGDGGPAINAKVGQPGQVAVDGAGNLVIAATRDQRIRVVAVTTGMFYGQQMTAGDIYTVAGGRVSGYFGDGGPAAKAGLFNPGGVALNGSGGLVIADSFNDRIRVVSG